MPNNEIDEVFVFFFPVFSCKIMKTEHIQKEMQRKTYRKAYAQKNIRHIV